jgi:hypothetical protein
MCAWPAGWSVFGAMTRVTSMAKVAQRSNSSKGAARLATPADGAEVPSNAAYDLDFYAWLVSQAQALGSKRSASLDWDNLAQEIDAMAASERHKLVSHLKVLLAHLLKWSWLAERRSPSWENPVLNARDELSDRLAASPSLKAKLDQALTTAYKRARREAGIDMGYDDREWNRLLPHNALGMWSSFWTKTSGPPPLNCSSRP